MDFFAARGLEADGPSTGRFLDVDPVVESMPDPDAVARDDDTGVARGFGCFARYPDFAGAGA